MNDMKRLLRYAGPYRRDMVLGAVLVLIETCFELFIPIMIALLRRRLMDGAQRFGRRSMRRCSSMHFPTWIISQCPL